jgi:hypothetical protein
MMVACVCEQGSREAGEAGVMEAGSWWKLGSWQEAGEAGGEAGVRKLGSGLEFEPQHTSAGRNQ